MIFGEILIKQVQYLFLFTVVIGKYFICKFLNVFYLQLFYYGNKKTATIIPNLVANNIIVVNIGYDLAGSGRTIAEIITQISTALIVNINYKHFNIYY